MKDTAYVEALSNEFNNMPSKVFSMNFFILE